MATKEWIGGQSGALGDYATAANWLASGVPIAADDVEFAPRVSMNSVDAGLDQSAVAIDEFRVRAGFSGNLGDEDNYLQIDPDSFRFEGTGRSYIDLGAAAIEAFIQNTKAFSSSMHGLYLVGSAISTLFMDRGNVGLAALPGETSTVTTLNVGYVLNRTSDADITCGAGLTLTNYNQCAGKALLRCACTTAVIDAGKMQTEGAGALTTVTINDGTFFPNSSGTITTLNMNGGTVDLSMSTKPRTITTANLEGGTLIYDPDVVTITNFVQPTEPSKVTIVSAH
jgi:hypothetical protein